MDLVQRLLEGDRRAAARLITLVENETEGIEAELHRLYPHTGRAHVVGVTGPPGGGKSTLVRALAAEFRRRGSTVGIIAVDPTSPFTGGAILGDRIRMQDLTGDSGVFIRSMASRGALGGLSRATADAVKVLDAFGSQVILVETVGAGQGEVDIARAADSTIVVEVPGMGDEIQVMKAGILEIADLFVVNKADREGADRIAGELRAVLAMGPKQRPWTPPVLKTVATSGQGVDEVANALGAHRRHLQDSGELGRRREENAVQEVVNAARDQILGELWADLGEQGRANMGAEVAARRLDPHSAARSLIARFRRAEC